MAGAVVGLKQYDLSVNTITNLLLTLLLFVSHCKTFGFV